MYSRNGTTFLYGLFLEYIIKFEFVNKNYRFEIT